MSDKNCAVVVAASCSSSIMSERSTDDDIEVEEGGFPLGICRKEGMSVFVVINQTNKWYVYLLCQR
jgi:hypothetical protein